MKNAGPPWLDDTESDPKPAWQKGLTWTEQTPAVRAKVLAMMAEYEEMLRADAAEKDAVVKLPGTPDE